MDTSLNLGFGPTGYEGPGVQFVSPCLKVYGCNTGTVVFTGGLPTGQSRYFVLEGAPSRINQVESRAGLWSTWILKRASELRPPGPPSVNEPELAVLRGMMTQTDAAGWTKLTDLVGYWNSGAPNYRWNQMARERLAQLDLAGQLRLMSLLNVAVYDATIAAWEAKYTYNRPRPGVADPSLPTVIHTPESPSYPSGFASVAGAASAILTYFFPNDGETFRSAAQDAAQSRLLAGVNYPSDTEAGLALGRAVAALAIDRAQHDDTNEVWSGTVPAGPCLWTGDNPVNPRAGVWKNWVPRNPVSAPPPPDCGSPAMAAELADLEGLNSDPKTRTAFEGRASLWATDPVNAWSDVIETKIFEYKLTANPPRAARTYALQYIALWDAYTAAFYNKYQYWRAAPYQLDSRIVPLVTPVNAPGYPSEAVTMISAAADVATYLFPRDAAYFHARAVEASNAVTLSGAYTRSDADAGLILGHSLSAFLIEYMRKDGAD